MGRQQDLSRLVEAAALAGVPLRGLPHPACVQGFSEPVRRRRVLLDLEHGLCVVDGERSFVRGRLEAESLSIPLWIEIEREAFRGLLDRWADPFRANLPPVAGWVNDRLAGRMAFEGVPVLLEMRPPGAPPRVRLHRAAPPRALGSGG